MEQNKILNTHTHHSVNTGEDFIIYLPVRRYELTLKNRLLDQLGGFSHFLLDVMFQLPEQGINWVLEVTGLSLQQLDPILKRLDGLGLLENNHLNKNGIKLARWKRYLHGEMRQIWLDGDYKHNIFFGRSDLETVEIQSDSVFVVRQWQQKDTKPRSWPCGDFREDSERQKIRILTHLEQYLPLIFEHFTDCFIEHGFHSQDWELVVRYNNISEERAIEVHIHSDQLHEGEVSEYSFFSPVLCLNTEYSLPEGSPQLLRDQLPGSHYKTATFVSIPEDDFELSQLMDSPRSAWIWPLVDQKLYEEITDYLFERIEVVDIINERLFNRVHLLKKQWRCMSFKWSSIEQSLHECGVVIIQVGST